MTPRAPLLVGLVLAAAVCGLTYFFVTTSKDTFSDDATYPLVADFSDASGVRWKTRVQITGIDVGKIDKIEHVRGDDGRLRARVHLRIGKQYDVFADARLTKAAESLLGDYRLELDPGTLGKRKLGPGDAISEVHALSDLDEIKGQLLQVARNVNQVTHSFADVLSGPNGEGSLRAILAKLEGAMAAIEQTTVALRHTITANDAAIGRIIHDVADIAHGLRAISAPGGDAQQAAHHVASVTAKLDRIADGVQDLLSGPQHDAAGAATANLRGTLTALNESIAHINDIVRKVDDGQGTLGRVVNDPAIADGVQSALDSANSIVGNVASLQTQIELRSEYDVPFNGANTQIQPAIKNTLGLRIIPKPDKYYVFEAISDPRGRSQRTLTSTQVNSGATVVADETVIAYNDLKFSAMFAKRYGPATLRFGIIENTGGLGVNLHGLHDRLELRLDAYDFDRRDPDKIRPVFPRLRATGMVELLRHVHAQGGIDDPLNAQLRTWFLGGVLRFTDDDLKAMLVVAPKP